MWTKNYNVGQTYNYEDEQAEYVEYAGGPLEGTRVHPESYTYARAMASEVASFLLALAPCLLSFGRPSRPCLASSPALSRGLGRLGPGGLGVARLGSREAFAFD